LLGRAGVAALLPAFALAEAVALASRARAVFAVGALTAAAVTRDFAVTLAVVLDLEVGVVLVTVLACVGLRAGVAAVFTARLVAAVLEAEDLVAAVFGRAALLRTVFKRVFFVLGSALRLLALLRGSALDPEALALGDFTIFLTEDIRSALLFGSALETEP
jgi:hypothetical protein